MANNAVLAQANTVEVYQLQDSRSDDLLGHDFDGRAL